MRQFSNQLFNHLLVKHQRPCIYCRMPGRQGLQLILVHLAMTDRTTDIQLHKGVTLHLREPQTGSGASWEDHINPKALHMSLCRHSIGAITERARKNTIVKGKLKFLEHKTKVNAFLTALLLCTVHVQCPNMCALNAHCTHTALRAGFHFFSSGAKVLSCLVCNTPEED